MNQALRFAALNPLAVVAGIWLGEHWSGPNGLLGAVLVAFALAALSTAWAWRYGRRGAVALAVITVIAFALPWVAAANESALAFNECITDGEHVREALAEYRNEHGAFPLRLSQLAVHLPGQLVLPPQLLRYQRVEAGYSLVFSDWLVTHEASDQEAFLARK